MKRFLLLSLVIFIVLSSFEIDIYADREFHKEFESLEDFTACQNGFTEREYFDAEFLFSYVRRNMFFEESGKYTLTNGIYYVPSAHVKAFLESEFIVTDEAFENMKKLKCDYYYTDEKFDTLTAYDSKKNAFLLQSDYNNYDDSFVAKYSGYSEAPDGSYDVYVKKYTLSETRPLSGDYTVNYNYFGKFDYLCDSGKYLVYNLVSNSGKFLKRSARICEKLPDGFVNKPDEYAEVNLMPVFRFAENAPYKTENFTDGNTPAETIAYFSRILFDYADYYDGVKFTVPAGVLEYNAYGIFFDCEKMRELPELSYDEENDIYTFSYPTKDPDKAYFADGYKKRSDGTYDVFLDVIDLKNKYVETDGGREYIDYVVKDGEKYTVLKDEGAVANFYYDGLNLKFVSFINGVLEKDDSGYTRLKAIDGDTDGNGTLDPDDAIYLLYHVYFPSDYPVEMHCDYNMDGITDPDDAIYLLYHIYFGNEYKLHI